MKAKLTAIVLYLNDLHSRGCFKCSKEVRDRSQRLDTTFQERRRSKTPYQKGWMEGSPTYMDLIDLNHGRPIIQMRTVIEIQQQMKVSVNTLYDESN